jgi:tetratricopeptide (TPR) repeat protein
MPDDQPVPEVTNSPPETPRLDAERSNRKSKKRSKKRPRQRRWEWIKSWSKTAVAIFAGVPSAVIAAWVLVSLLVLTFHRHSLDLDAISVPETLSKAGFTNEVATQHLRDAIFAVQQPAQTSMAKTAVDTNQDLSGITIPKTGLSLQSMAVALRSLLPGWRHEVSGEFVQLEHGISLRLRLNGRLIFSETAEDISPEAADILLGKGLQGGAFRVVQESQPYLAASALLGNGKTEKQRTAAYMEADRVIAMFPAEDESAIRAVALKGLIAQYRRDDAQAEIFYTKLPQFAPARYNLGEIYDRQHKPDMAILEFQAAISLDPALGPQGHIHLGNIYYEQHHLE